MPPKPLLAATLSEKDFPSLHYPLLGSPKIDGIRALAFEGALYSRSGKLLPNKYLQSVAKYYKWHGFDGEIVIGEPNVSETFKVTRGPIMRQDGEPSFVYHVFDYWDFVLPYEERLELVAKYLTAQHPSLITQVTQTKLTSLDEMLALEKRAINDGYEGIMLRSPRKLYKNGRSTLLAQTLIKLKRFESDEAIIIGYEERKSNQNPNIQGVFGEAKRSTNAENLVPCGDLGSFLVRMINGRFAGTTCSVGTGFSSAERVSFWEKRQEMLGLSCVVKWFAPGSDQAPRLPSWKGLREDGE